MAGLGGVLGSIRGDGGMANGIPQRRNTRKAHGTSLAPGRGAGAFSSGGMAPDAEREAEQARINAERQARANARTQAKPLPASTFEDPPNPAGGDVVEQEGSPNPYADMKKDPEVEAYKKAVGGGSMGTKPDFTGRDDALKELDNVDREVINNYKRREANPFSQALGIGEQEHARLMTQRQFLLEKAQREERLAYQRAIQAQQAAAPEEQELVPDAVVPGTGGQRVVRDRYGRMSPAEAQRQIKNEGPLAAEFNPYSGAEFATVKEPVIDASYAQASLPKKSEPVSIKDPGGNLYIEDNGSVKPANVPGWQNEEAKTRAVTAITNPAKIAVRQATPGAAPKTPAAPRQQAPLRPEAQMAAEQKLKKARFGELAKAKGLGDFSTPEEIAAVQQQADREVDEELARRRGAAGAPAQGGGAPPPAQGGPVAGKTTAKVGGKTVTYQGGDPEKRENWK